MNRDKLAILIPLSEVKVGERMRKDLGEIDDLAESLKENGLLQPIVISHNKELIAGGRRTAAAKKLGWEEIPARLIETLDEAALRKLEVEENVQRKDMTWQERTMGVYAVHTANEKAHRKWTTRQTGGLLGYSHTHVNNIVLIAQRIISNDKDILECKTFTDAVKLLLDRKQREVNAKLAAGARTKPSKKPEAVDLDINTDMEMPESFGLTGMYGVANPVTTEGEETSEEAGEVSQIDLDKYLFHGDGVDLMAEKFSHKSLDAIISDLPYGIEMDYIQQNNQGKNIEATRKEHGVEANLDLLRRLIEHAPFYLKEQGFLAFWHDVAHYGLIVELARQNDFLLQRWPVIWDKPYPCQNNAAYYNTTKNYEVLFILRKPKTMLKKTAATSVWTHGFSEEDSIFHHPFRKPLTLWRRLLDLLLNKGDRFYDPCAGCGSSVYAGVTSGYQPYATEINQDHYHELIINTQKAYENVLGEVRFTANKDSKD